MSVKCGGPILSYHFSGSKDDKKKNLKASPSVVSKSSLNIVKSSNIVEKPSISTTSSLATALIDEKTKLRSASITLRPMNLCVKSISRDGILNSKKTLRQREIKMPLSKPAKKDKLDDSQLLAPVQHFVESRIEEIQQNSMKQNLVNGKIQVLATPQQNRIIDKKIDLVVDSSKWNESRRMHMLVDVDNESPLKKRQRVDVVSETPIKR